MDIVALKFAVVLMEEKILRSDSFPADRSRVQYHHNMTHHPHASGVFLLINYNMIQM